MIIRENSRDNIRNTRVLLLSLVLLDIDPGIDDSRLPVDGWEMEQKDLGGKLRVGEQQIRLAGREFLPPIHRQTVYAFEETALPSETELLTTVIFYVFSMRQQFVGEVTVEYHPATEEDPKERYACRELVDNVDVTLFCEEEQVEHQQKLSEVCKKNVEEAKYGPRKEERGVHMCHFQSAWATN